MREGVNYVLEADIKGFFDNLDQGWLMKFLAHDIADRNFLRYIKRFLKAGIMDGNERLESDRGCRKGDSYRQFWPTCTCTTCSIYGWSDE